LKNAGFRLVWLEAVVLPLLYIDVVNCLSFLCCRYKCRRRKSFPVISAMQTRQSPFAGLMASLVFVWEFMCL
jgi:hypothetical protein